MHMTNLFLSDFKHKFVKICVREHFFFAKKINLFNWLHIKMLNIIMAQVCWLALKGYF